MSDSNNVELTAKNMKNILWETLQNLRSGDVQPGEADAIAQQSREIIRTTNTQLRICQVAKVSVPSDLTEFATSAK